MVHLQGLYERFNDKGLVILGFNCTDGDKVGGDAMRQFGVTYPVILDASDDAVDVCDKNYHGGTLPLSYIIDRDGQIVDAWFVDEEGYPRAKAALEKTGGELAEAVRRNWTK